MRPGDWGIGLRDWIERHPKTIITAVIVLALLLPVAGEFSPVITRVGTLTLIYMILALGLNIVPGLTGLLDLGFVGFFAVGAYTAAILSNSLWPWDNGWPDWGLPAVAAIAIAHTLLIMVIGLIHGAIWGILLGAPTLRLTGDYFAIVTFGFSELVLLILRNEAWLTNGPQGISGIPAPFGINPGSPLNIFGLAIPVTWIVYVTCLLTVIGVVILCWRLERSRTGRAFLAIREDAIAAEACGINIVRYKIMAFAMSASIGALAGTLYARMQSFIGPQDFSFFESILVLCLIVLGGMGSIVGVMVGALVMIPLMEVLRSGLGFLGGKIQEWEISWISADLGSAHYLVLGIIMIVMMRFRPAGLLPKKGTRASVGKMTVTMARFTGVKGKEDNHNADTDSHRRDSESSP